MKVMVLDSGKAPHEYKNKDPPPCLPRQPSISTQIGSRDFRRNCSLLKSLKWPLQQQ